MKRSGSTKNYLLATSVLVVVGSPNLLRLFATEGGVHLKDFFYLFLAVALLIAPTIILPLRPYLRSITLFIFGIPPFLYHYRLYGGLPSISAYGAVFETDKEEVLGILPGTEMYLFGTLLVVIGINFLISHIDRTFSLPQRGKGAILVFALVPFLFILQRDYTIATSVGRTVAFEPETRIVRTYPFGELIKIYQAYREQQMLASAMKNKSAFTFQATKRKVIDQREIYVVIIGETARYHNFSINGYLRKNSPRLSALESVIPFSDVTSMSNQTRTSVPMTFTRATPRKPDLFYSEQSVVTAFREAGFVTYWLSNTPALSRNDTTTSLIAREAEEVTLVHGSADDSDLSESSRDDRLLKPLADRLAKKDKKVIIFLQTLGSHFRYATKYPEAFDVFQPSGRDSYDAGFGNIEKKEELINSYDNSILFTDYLIGNVIDAVAAEDAVSTVLYFSDHGENIFDDDRKLFSHGSLLPSEYELHVPLFIWSSVEYQKVYPDKWRMLTAHKDARLSLENLFHTILDMADVTYREETLSESFAAPSFRPTHREVLTLDREVLSAEDILASIDRR